MLFSNSITIVFDAIDFQTDEHGEHEFTCNNTSSTSIMWNNLNGIRGKSIIATFCLANINLIMQFMNGSGSNIIKLTKFDGNIVAIAELVLNLFVYLIIN